MTSTALAVRSDFLLAPEELFPGPDSKPLAALMAEHSEKLALVDQVASAFSGDTFAPVVPYFLAGNTDPEDRSIPSWVAERIFAREGAVNALAAEYWGRALELTDVLQVMPQGRRDEWYEAIRKRKVPGFTPEAVAATIGDLLASRSKFFAEKVDGSFRRLSGDHVTNLPGAFRRRMIFSGVLSYGNPSDSGCGHISDLRSAIAKFTGTEEPPWRSTYHVVAAAFRQHGEWIDVDGGAFRMRAYLKGTVHLEVHPDMAWRLNCVLHSLYPRAIAEEHRRPEKKVLRGVKPIQRPLPHQVVEILADLRSIEHHRPGYKFSGTCRERDEDGDENDRSDRSKVAVREAVRVLEYLGGVVKYDGWTLAAEFDYDARPALDRVVASGCVPDVESHQFYPTPEKLARLAVDLAEIGSADSVLEPSAGLGAIATLLPRERTTCVELSKLHAVVLRQKGLEVVEGDFLAWETTRCFDRVVANPPFADGRWRAHLVRMAELVADGGLIVVILPASARGKDVLPGWRCAWTESFADEFAGASVSVAILTARRG